ncbi:MAG: ADP-ribosylation/crystallin J1 [Crocinitomicaceae bacterium]
MRKEGIMTKTVELYRPVGEKEMILIIESDFSKFPSRLEWQPIFYPVLNEQYACDIASQWNTNDEFGNYLGIVTKFEISEEEFLKYKIENVGAKHSNELWVPSEDLDRFNKSIIGKIEVIKIFVGSKFENANHPIIIKLIKTKSLG